MPPKKGSRQLTVPGSASAEPYHGSRLQAQRFSHTRPTWKGCVVFRRHHREEQIKSQALEQEREHDAVTVIEFCVVLDRKRRLWEIPKGGMVIGGGGSKCDASGYDTAVREVWEEAGLYITDRRAPRGAPTFMTWVDQNGNILSEREGSCDKYRPAWMVTEFRHGDRMVAPLASGKYKFDSPDGPVTLEFVDPALARAWMTASDFWAVSPRDDHSKVLFQVDKEAPKIL